jgi:4-diphosphocytidyl-2-C-methyl-D-erythritol kinase
VVAERRRTGSATFAEPAAAETAYAKVNLTLRVVRRRDDGYHDLESLVAFAAFGDRVVFRPGAKLELRVAGPTASDAGPLDDNLVLKAARRLAERVEDLRLGRFGLVKRLPAGAGLGGGSADAAAALRLLARANGLALDDDRVVEAARKTGADVPVCLDPRARWMRGTGDILSAPVALPKLPAVLVHPGQGLETRLVFGALRISPRPSRREADVTLPPDRAGLVQTLARDVNDLEPPAVGLAPVIGEILDVLRPQPGCDLARMTGSGSACFGLFRTQRAAGAAARAIATAYPAWWVKATTLG